MKPKAKSHPLSSAAKPAPKKSKIANHRSPASSAIDTPRSETILLAVTGMSPAVLTETVWALAQEEPPRIPNRVLVITTAAGRQCIEKELFSPLPEYDGQCVW